MRVGKDKIKHFLGGLFDISVGKYRWNCRLHHLDSVVVGAVQDMFKIGSTSNLQS